MKVRIFCPFSKFVFTCWKKRLAKWFNQCSCNYSGRAEEVAGQVSQERSDELQIKSSLMSVLKRLAQLGFSNFVLFTETKTCSIFSGRITKALHPPAFMSTFVTLRFHAQVCRRGDLS